MTKQIVKGDLSIPDEVEAYFDRYLSEELHRDHKIVKLPSGLDIFIKSGIGGFDSQIDTLMNHVALQRVISKELSGKADYDVKVIGAYCATHDYMVMPLLKIPCWQRAEQFAYQISNGEDIRDGIGKLRENRIGYDYPTFPYLDTEENFRLFNALSQSVASDNLLDYANGADGRGILQLDIRQLAQRNGFGCDTCIANIFIESYDASTHRPSFILIDQSPRFLG